MTDSPSTTASQRRMLRRTVTWAPKRDDVRSDPPVALDGKSDSTTAGGSVMVWLKPHRPRWAFQTYGVETEKTPYEIVGRPQDLQKMVRGDELIDGDFVLILETAPVVVPEFGGIEKARCMALLESTGGRRG